MQPMAGFPSKVPHGFEMFADAVHMVITGSEMGDPQVPVHVKYDSSSHAIKQNPVFCHIQLVVVVVGRLGIRIVNM